MKKVLASLTLLFVIVGAIMAAAPTAPTLYNNTDASVVLSNDIYAVGNSQAGNNGTGRDSLKGQDTIVLLNKYPVDARYQYVAQIWDSTKSTDTLHYEIQYYSGDGRYKSAITTTLDSAIGGSPAAGVSGFKAIDLALNQTSWPGFVTLTVRKPTTAQNALIRRFELIQRRPRSAGSLIGN